MKFVAPSADAGLDVWLDWIDKVHPAEMELGLSRVSGVATALGLDDPPLVIATVGGTNGKGSAVAMLEAIWLAAGYRTGAATSPHVELFNERMRVGGRMATDADIVGALAAVEAARGDTALTYFEFATLASMQLFVTAGCDVAIMEVGLGGRLDAVNLWDADGAVLTSIALDHADWLGTDRAVIATEKAAIGRRGRPLIVGDPCPPASLAPFAAEHGMDLQLVAEPDSPLPETSLAGRHQQRNAAAALGLVNALQDQLPVTARQASDALRQVALAARFEAHEIDGVALVLDVAHNPAAAEALASTWRERFPGTRGVLLFAALADKDIEGIAHALSSVAAHWVCPAMNGARCTPVAELVERVGEGIRMAGVDSLPGDSLHGVLPPDDARAGDARVFDARAGDAQAGDAQAGDAQAGHAQAGHAQTGDLAMVEAAASVDIAFSRAMSIARERRLPMLVCGSFLTLTAVMPHLSRAGCETGAA